MCEAGTVQSDSNVSASQAGKATSLARRRYQQGALSLEGAKGNEKWILRYRDDVITAEGRKRPEVRVMLGSLRDLPTEKLARRAAEKALARVNSINFQPGVVATVDEFARTFEQDAVPLMKKSARASTRSIVRRHIVPRLGPLQLHEIGQRQGQQFISYLLDLGLEKKTIKNIVGILCLMLVRAKEWNYLIGELDRDLLKYPADAIEKQAPHFTIDQSMSIVDEAKAEEGESWALMYEVMARTGLRLGEALGLAWPAIDFDALVIRVVQSCVLGELDSVKSRKSRRDLPLPEDLAERLAAYRASTWVVNRYGLLWATADGEPMRGDVARADHLKPILAKCGIQAGAFHAFRHGHATNLFSAGANPKAVQDLMGHEDLETTMRYTHSVTRDQRDGVEAVSARFSRVPENKQPQAAMRKHGGLRLVK